MAFQKQAKQSALQWDYVMSQQWVTCYYLIAKSVPQNMGGRATVAVCWYDNYFYNK